MSCDACPRALNGWFRACLTAAATLGALPVIGTILMLPYRGLQESLGASAAVVIFVLLMLVLTCLLSMMPAALVILFSESFRIRSILFYAPSGAAIGALIAGLIFGTSLPFSALFGLAGCVAGITYWFVAGRYAGEERRRYER